MGMIYAWFNYETMISLSEANSLNMTGWRLIISTRLGKQQPIMGVKPLGDLCCWLHWYHRPAWGSLIETKSNLAIMNHESKSSTIEYLWETDATCHFWGTLLRHLSHLARREVPATEDTAHQGAVYLKSGYSRKWKESLNWLYGKRYIVPHQI